MADRLSAAPRKARPLTGRGRLPSTENLLNKTPEELVRTLNRFGIDPDLAAIERRASDRAMERAFRAFEQGVEPDEATWAAIDQSAERGYVGTIRQMTKAAIRNYHDNRRKGESKYATWVSIGDDRVCPSCEPRHGQTNTWRVWDQLGKPGSAALICSQECRCELVPGESVPQARAA